jgi:hypothetical protein
LDGINIMLQKFTVINIDASTIYLYVVSKQKVPRIMDRITNIINKYVKV